MLQLKPAHLRGEIKKGPVLSVTLCSRFDCTTYRIRRRITETRHNSTSAIPANHEVSYNDASPNFFSLLFPHFNFYQITPRAQNNLNQLFEVNDCVLKQSPGALIQTSVSTKRSMIGKQQALANMQARCHCKKVISCWSEMP
jgi:hypothetical protein